MKRSLLIPLVPAALFTLIVPAPVPAFGADTTILVQNMSFVDGSRKVTQGSVVTWSFKDGLYTHTTTSDQGFWSEVGVNNGTAKVTFNSAGIFSYYCAIHPHMTGVITVPLKKSKIVGGKRVQWSMAKETGRTYDVQIKRPGDTTWSMFRVATPKLAVKFRSSTPGKYFFRARTRNDVVAKYSGWSPAKGVKVTAP